MHNIFRHEVGPQSVSSKLRALTAADTVLSPGALLKPIHGVSLGRTPEVTDILKDNERVRLQMAEFYKSNNPGRRAEDNAQTAQEAEAYASMLRDPTIVRDIATRDGRERYIDQRNKSIRAFYEAVLQKAQGRYTSDIAFPRDQKSRDALPPGVPYVTPSGIHGIR